MMEPESDLASQLALLDGREAYLSAASEMLASLFPSNYVAWNSIDASTGAAEVLGMPEYVDHEAVGKLLLECIDHPTVLSYLSDTSQSMWEPRRLSDLVSDTQLHETLTYQLLFGPLDAERQLTVMTARITAASARCWAMTRPDMDFTDREVELARQIQPTLRLLEAAYAADPTPAAATLANDVYGLTMRERDVMNLLGKGLTGMAIAHLLGISPRTVAKHLEHAYAKLNCTNRVDALRILRDSGSAAV